MNVRDFAAIAGATALALIAWSHAVAATGEVTVRLFQFKPGTLEVKAGTQVTWTNQDDIEHTVTSGTPDKRDQRFGDRLPGKGQTITVEFSTSGVYPYFCERHQSMRGEIRVN